MFRLVALDELTSAERDRLGGVRRDGDITFALVPVAGTLSAKVISDDIVALLRALESPSPLSRELRALIDKERGFLERLVLDSVLEIEHEGRFIVGAAAAELLPLDAPAAGESAAFALSLAALRYAEALAIDDAPLLSARMYSYHRIPVSPRWTELLGTSTQVDAWLGIGDGAPLRALLDRTWVDTPPLPDNPAWRHFRSPERRGRAPFKLYVNPRPGCLREALEAVVPLFARHGLAGFKVGRDVSGILRPDKLVAYAPTRAHVDAAADDIMRRLHGMPAHAVPFTAAIDREGLVSWGMDPPRSERLSSWQGNSWRRWITDRLAVSVVAARAAGASSPTQFALQRLAFEGIDVGSFTPTAVEWAP